MTQTSGVVLYSYYRSSSSWRVRTALALKGITYECRPINLLKGEQHQEEYAKLNPLKMVPALFIDNKLISQSLSILEYLEETRSAVPLLPKDPYHRAEVRSMCQIIASDIQPLQNLRVLKMIGDEKSNNWAEHWINIGFQALESKLKLTAGKYCFGDVITMIDVCLVPQVYAARRFKVNLSLYPTITRIEAELLKISEFQEALPQNQPDYPE